MGRRPRNLAQDARSLVWAGDPRGLRSCHMDQRPRDSDQGATTHKARRIWGLPGGRWQQLSSTRRRLRLACGPQYGATCEAGPGAGDGSGRGGTGIIARTAAGGIPQWPHAAHPKSKGFHGSATPASAVGACGGPAAGIDDNGCGSSQTAAVIGVIGKVCLDGEIVGSRLAPAGSSRCAAQHPAAWHVLERGHSRRLTGVISSRDPACDRPGGRRWPRRRDLRGGRPQRHGT